MASSIRQRTEILLGFTSGVEGGGGVGGGTEFSIKVFFFLGEDEEL